MQDPSSRSRHAICVLAAHALLLTAIACVYLQAPSLDYVDFDDFLYVVDNPVVQGGPSIESFLHAWTDVRGGYFAPLLWLSYLLDVAWLGHGPSAHHLVNVLLHAANASLVLELLRRGTGKPIAAFGVALIFAIHPVQVESVAWITERKNVLSLLFGLVAIAFYASWTRRERGGLYGAALAATACSLLVKATFVTLPFLLLLIDIWPLKRLAPSLRAPALDRRIREKLPFLGLSLASAISTYVAQAKSGAVASVGYLGPGPRLENAVVSYVRYLGELAWPVHLAALYPYPSLLGHDMWSAAQVVGALALLVAVSAVALALRSRALVVPVGWLWFVGALVPLIGLVQAGDQSMADRHLYVPILGLLSAVVFGLASLRVGRRMRRGGCALLLTAAAALGWRAHGQVETWRDTLTLFEHATLVTRDNWIALNNVAWLRAACPQAGVRDPAKAVQLAERAVEITRHGEPEILDTLAAAYASAGRQHEAEGAARAAVRLAEARRDGSAGRFRERLATIRKQIPIEASRGCPR